jgi:hypothetical protein
MGWDVHDVAGCSIFAVSYLTHFRHIDGRVKSRTKELFHPTVALHYTMVVFSSRINSQQCGLRHLSSAVALSIGSTDSFEDSKSAGGGKEVKEDEKTER